MSSPAESLPAEYRTPSLESLPEDLQALAVKNIKKKFGLEKKEKVIKPIKREGISYDIQPGALWDVSQDFADPYASISVARFLFRVEITDVLTGMRREVFKEIVVQDSVSIDIKSLARTKVYDQIYREYSPSRYAVRILN